MIYFYTVGCNSPTKDAIMSKGGHGDQSQSPESKNLDTNTIKAMKNIMSSLLTTRNDKTRVVQGGKAPNGCRVSLEPFFKPGLPPLGMVCTP